MRWRQSPHVGQQAPHSSPRMLQFFNKCACLGQSQNPWPDSWGWAHGKPTKTFPGLVTVKQMIFMQLFWIISFKWGWHYFVLQEFEGCWKVGVQLIYLCIFNKCPCLQNTFIQVCPEYGEAFLYSRWLFSINLPKYAAAHARKTFPSHPQPASMRHRYFIKTLASLVHSHFHAPSQPVTQTLTAMITSEVFSCFVFYGTLLTIKMYIVAIITGQVRLRKKVRACGQDEERKNCVITCEKLYNIFLPNKGFCEPGGRSETRRITVPQRGSICGEMPEVD